MDNSNQGRLWSEEMISDTSDDEDIASTPFKRQKTHDSPKDVNMRPEGRPGGPLSVSSSHERSGEYINIHTNVTSYRLSLLCTSSNA